MTATPTETMRKATHTLAAAIVKAVVDGKEMPLPFDWPSEVPIDCPDCPVTDAEELIFQLAQEITLLTAKGDRSVTQEAQNASSSWQDHVAAYPRDEFLAEFREAHATLHRLWTAAVGKEGYDKETWKIIDNALGRFARDAAEKVGIGRSESLL